MGIPKDQLHLLEHLPFAVPSGSSSFVAVSNAHGFPGRADFAGFVKPFLQLTEVQRFADLACGDGDLAPFFVSHTLDLLHGMRSVCRLPQAFAAELQQNKRRPGPHASRASSAREATSQARAGLVALGVCLVQLFDCRHAASRIPPPGFAALPDGAASFCRTKG